jgi:proteasome lid subunit RPN8/RPN11
MGRRVTVAYESKARERAASKAAAKLVWHRAPDGGLYADGCGGKYHIARQRPTRRHGIYKWGVRLHKSGLAGLDVGSADDIPGAKALANRHDRAGAREALETAPANEERRGGGSYRGQVVKALRLMGRSDAETYADRRAQDVERYDLAGVDPTVAAAILDAADSGFDDMRGQEGAKENGRESPTKGEWEVIVTDPPRAHWGHILSMAGPGYGYRAGNKIILDGFYDDEEARHVANSISRKYGAMVTFGPKRKMEAAEDSHPGAAEERRRPGAGPKEDCSHGCPAGECKPFTKLERDPVAFKACMARATAIGELNTSRRMYDLVRGDIEKRDREVFLVVCIDFRGQVRDYVELSIGQRHRVAVDVEDILQVIILSGCDGAIVAHCHPSGNPEPSQADRQLTKSIEKAMKVACPNVPLVDHIIVGSDAYFSFSDGKVTRIKN